MRMRGVKKYVVVSNLADGWGINVYIPNYGWETALYPLALSGVESPWISHVAHNFVKKVWRQQCCVDWSISGELMRYE